MIQKRKEARREKVWELADSIRNGLAELGITLEDTAKGTAWRRKI
jgi:cysteinyl-tRNA synthetase